MITVFRHVLRYRDRCIFVLQDDLRVRPQETMVRLCHEIGVAPGDMRFDRYFRNEPDTAATELLDPALLAEARAIYEQISKAALTGDALPISTTSQVTKTVATQTAGGHES